MGPITGFSSRRIAAVHHDDSAGHETCLGGGQKHDDLRDFFRPRRATDRVMRPETLEQRATVGHRVSQKARYHSAGCDGIDPDAAGSELDRQDLVIWMMAPFDAA